MTMIKPARTRAFAPLLATTALLLMGAPLHAGAQAPRARNAVYFELGGNAILYSLNYERRLTDLWGARAGFMVVSLSGTDAETGQHAEVDAAIIPIMMNALLGRGTHRFELGLGPLFVIGGGRLEDAELGETDEFSGAGLAGVTSTIGYRRQPADGGFVFRAALNPFYSGTTELWAGLSFGWSF